MKFWKMSGSGNDFVFVNGIADPSAGRQAVVPAFVRQLCAAHTGVGADGVAVLQVSPAQDFSLAYLNRDGSVGELCGNASLCAVRLGVELGLAKSDHVSFGTGAGVLKGRIVDGRPEVDLQPLQGLRADAGISKQPGEHELGFVEAGVPHLVIRSDDAASVLLADRGPELRFHSSLREGANVNWVSPADGGRWRMRTFERGVEAETLACGTGAVACAALLKAWGRSGDATDLITRSGRVLSVRLRETPAGTVPTLAGEARIVFEAELREL
ncbi:MAG: diaminopimelate epimerase [Gemmatimonadaceae bacterium]